MLIYLRKYPQSFDPETVTLLCDALDSAWANIQAADVAFQGPAEDVRNLLAKYIVDLALQGERDRQRLIDGALVRLSL